MIVADLMRKNFISVDKDEPLKKVNEIFHHFNIDYILVMEEGKMLGLVTYSDLFRQILPPVEEVMKDESYWLVPKNLEENAKEKAGIPVHQIMTKNVITVTPGTSVVRAGAIMTAKRIKQLPVVENEKVVGVISYRDITWGFLMKYGR